MKRLLFAQLTDADLDELVDLRDTGVAEEPWATLAEGEITSKEQGIIDYVTETLRHISPTLLNEATVWGRAIFPLLWLAEVRGVQVQANVPLTVQLGAYGTPFAGGLRAPFLAVVEAKRGVEGYSPVVQLYGEMLAAACLNAHHSGRRLGRLFGCYTVADTWTFVCAEVDDLKAPRPVFSVVTSPEMSQKSDAVRIVKILKSIVAEQNRKLAEPRA